jgi:hypothetical protein
MGTLGRWARKLALGLGVACAAPATAQQKVVLVPWGELEPLISFKKITLVLVSGDRIEGRVWGVEPDALVLRITKTTSPKTYPKRVTSVPRSEVMEIRLRQARYGWRVLGTAVGGVVGLVAGWYAALIICADESPGCTTPANAAFIGIIGGMATLGHLAARDADRRETIIKISPPLPADRPEGQENALIQDCPGGTNEVHP